MRKTKVYIFAWFDVLCYFPVYKSDVIENSAPESSPGY